MARQEVTGPTTLAIGPGETSTTGQYTASKTPATWSVAVLDDGALDPGDYTVTISATGLVTISLLPGATIPPLGTTMSIEVSASSGSGGGNNDSLVVSVTIDGDAVPCFVAGTLIDTPDGLRPVETLRVGDTVLTRDGRAVPIRWIGSRRLSAAALRHAPWLRPIRIRRDAFGPGRPAQDLRVSPQHRIHLDGWRAELLFGAAEVLAHAVHLVNDHSITRTGARKDVHYVHFALDRHEVVLANGQPTETLFPGDLALAALPSDDVRELVTLFPELADAGPGPQLYARCLKRHEARIFAP